VLELLAASLLGHGHVALPGDVGEAPSIARAVREFGRVDVLIVNAGVTHYMPFAALPLEKAEQMVRVNWLGTIYSTGCRTGTASTGARRRVRSGRRWWRRSSGIAARSSTRRSSACFES
jgi:NAD(P)-dependent dehydrogenase (short-subunit alcohol dehydrogenase family)